MVLETVPENYYLLLNTNFLFKLNNKLFKKRAFFSYFWIFIKCFFNAINYDKKIFIALILTVSFSCSSVKKTQEAINYGNYDQAIQIAVNQLRDHKSKKGNQEYILLLEDAFKKATLKDTEHIAFLKKKAIQQT